MIFSKPDQSNGISYYTPSHNYNLRGRDSLVDITWKSGVKIPLCDQDYEAITQNGEQPGYDAVGRGMYQALRRNPDCENADYYANILKEAYPHIVSELGGQIVMLEAKEVDTPYLDRKVVDLKIMALIDPSNSGLHREIARTFVEKGSRLATLHQAVASWYGAEKHYKLALEKGDTSHITRYELGETFYVLGRYADAAELWSELLPSCSIEEQSRLSARIAQICAGKTPLVPPIDYLSAIAVAVEEHQACRYDSAIAILQDVLADEAFCSHFPPAEIYYLLGDCYKDAGMMDEAAEAFKRS